MQALQLRPSLAHLDKEKEQSAAKKKSAAAAAEEEDAKPAEMLQQLTVQVKRRETEQQTEARLRSYAHLAAQEEADQWVPLDFYGANSGERPMGAARCLAGHWACGAMRSLLVCTVHFIARPLIALRDTSLCCLNTRLRAHLPACPLPPPPAELAQTIWDKLIGVQAADVAHTLSREQYLEAIVPGQHPF
jgi:hypothetical protein